MFCDSPKHKHLKCTIYRGVGGGGDATSDIEVNLLSTLSQTATDAATSATASAATATTQASNASSSASTAAASAALAQALAGTAPSQTGNAGKFLTTNGTATSWGAAVTSVAATVPSFLSVAGSPITSSGTLAISLSGTALPVANGGTGVTSSGTSGNVLTSNGTSWVSTVPLGEPVGKLMFYAANSAPTGYLKANGAAISRTTYAALFTVIGTTFGVGDGSTTFNVPDMRGYFARGWVDNGTIDSGRAFGSTQIDGFKAHAHSTTPYAPGGAAAFLATTYNSFFDGASGVSGSTGGTETRPYNVAFLACIKY